MRAWIQAQRPTHRTAPTIHITARLHRAPVLAVTEIPRRCLLCSPSPGLSFSDCIGLNTNPFRKYFIQGTFAPSSLQGYIRVIRMTPRLTRSPQSWPLGNDEYTLRTPYSITKYIALHQAPEVNFGVALAISEIFLYTSSPIPRCPRDWFPWTSLSSSYTVQLAPSTYQPGQPQKSISACAKRHHETNTLSHNPPHPSNDTNCRDPPKYLETGRYESKSLD